MSYPQDGGGASGSSVALANQYVTPTNGQNVQMTANALNGTLYLTPAATITSLTVTLPPNTVSQIGQVRRIASSQTITNLTVVNPSGGTVLVSGSLTPGSNIGIEKMADASWMQQTV